MNLLSKQEMSELDRMTIEDFGLPSSILMENAGKGCVEIIQTITDNKDPILVLCGNGNNGGDGFVIARWLYSKGYNPNILLFGEVNRMSIETKRNYDLIENLQIPLIKVESEKDWCKYRDTTLRELTLQNLSIVDALFGIGFKGTLPNLIREAFTFINKIEAKRIAIDIPSGVEANTGYVNELAFKAEETLTMAYPKYGLYLGEGRKYSGKVTVVDIGIPHNYFKQRKPYAKLITEENAEFPNRNQLSHKGNFGRIGIIAGSPGYSGAAILACRAALKSGAGLITLFHPQGMENIFEIGLVEVMTKPLPFSAKDPCIQNNHSSESLIKEDKIAAWLEELNKYDALLIGPGIGINPLSLSLINSITNYWEKPLVIDADGINILAENPEWARRLSGKEVVLTPHLKEFSRLSNIDVDEVKKDSISHLKRYTQEHNVAVLLKDATTVFSRNEELIFDISGNDGLATGGSGDVLSGIIVSFLGQKLTLKSAATSASFLLGRTAEYLSLKKQTPAITPSEIIENLFIKPQ